MKIILRWIILSLAVWLTAQLFDGIIVESFWVVLIVGACLTLFNMIIKPVINLLTLPINIITLGLFSLLINGVVFWYISIFIEGFVVATFLGAFLGSLIVSVLNWVLTKLFHFD